MVTEPNIQTASAARSIILVAVELAEARKDHEEAKSDPARNVGTGQKLYTLQRNFEVIIDTFARQVPHVLEALRAEWDKSPAPSKPLP